MRLKIIWLFSENSKNNFIFLYFFNPAVCRQFSIETAVNCHTIHRRIVAAAWAGLTARPPAFKAVIRAGSVMEA